MKEAGIGGPYAIALGPRCYAGVIEITEKGGYPLLQHLGLILGGPVVWATAVDGAICSSERGGEHGVGVDLRDHVLAHEPDRLERAPRASPGPMPNTSWSAPAPPSAWHCVERVVGVADDHRPAADRWHAIVLGVASGMSSGHCGHPSGCGNVSW